MYVSVQYTYTPNNTEAVSYLVVLQQHLAWRGALLIQVS